MKKCNVCNIEKDESEYRLRYSKCKLCIKIQNTCIHKIRKTNCKECGGSAFCEPHGIIKSICKECKGGSICDHNKRKSECIECDGSQICEHKKLKVRCKECGGSSFCEHDKRKDYCKLCKGSSICCHDKRKDCCIDCNGSQICKHKIHKSRCKECGGSAFCHHNKYKKCCIICTPNTKYYCTECRLFIVNKMSNYLCNYCNPNKPLRIKTKELNLKTFLEESQYEFEYNIRCIYQNISYFPDFKINCDNFWIIIECDEFAHIRCDKKDEKIRENNICFSLNKPCVFIRFNPDNKKFKKKVDIRHKNKVLKSYIEYYMNKNITENTVEYLFY